MHDSGVIDAAGDAAGDGNLPLGPWGAPTPIDITPVADDDPSATGDLLELYFNRANDIYVTTRASTTDPWGTPIPVDELNSTASETTPEVSSDGLTIYFASARTPTLGGNDIWMATRASRTAAWTGLTHVVELSSASADGAATQADARTIVIDTDRAGATMLDIYIATRATPNAAWDTPQPIAPLNTGDNDGNPMLSADKLTIYFDSIRTGDNEVFAATRTSANGAFGAAAPIMELSSANADTDPWISPDSRTMYFTSNRDGTQRLWQTTR
jgi:Tol biopolymer transport system component